jgi:hypothetical protein
MCCGLLTHVLVYEHFLSSPSLQQSEEIKAQHIWIEFHPMNATEIS